MNSSNVFITTSIPYVNATAHVGHAQEFVFTDALARLYRTTGRHVVFQTGTDENAFKNVLSARSHGLEPLEFVSQNAAKFLSLLDTLDVSYDTFIRTTEDRHAKGVNLFWRTLKKDDLYSKTYRGLYCQGCEDFYLEKDLIDGVCPDHQTKPLPTEEENIFFRLSDYQQQLEDLIVSEKIRIVPAYRKNEILSFIRGGLQDISLTRDADRSGGWGIRVPGNQQQVVYVWIDALINYLTGQGYGESENWRDVWNEGTHKVHVIGKNVWKFHAVYWPALLLSAGLPLPNEIVIHGFLTTNGQKISKSLGNAIDPTAIVSSLGVDALRNYLLSELSIFGDADFSEEGVRASYNKNLANNLGNLVSRLATLCRKAEFSLDIGNISRQEEGPALDDVPLAAQTALHGVWNKVSQINAEINETKPWELIRAGNQVAINCLLGDWISRLYNLSFQLSCFLPSAGRRLKQAIENGLAAHESALFPRIE